MFNNFKEYIANRRENSLRKKIARALADLELNPAELIAAETGGDGFNISTVLLMKQRGILEKDAFETADPESYGNRDGVDGKKVVKAIRRALDVVCH
jgi:hypothetical protein